MPSPLTVTRCQTYIADLPIVRPHVCAFGAPDEVNYTLVKIETEDGFVGWGEAATFGGPTWSEETAETIQIVIDAYIVPHLMGKSLLDFGPVLSIIQQRVCGNHFAKAAVEFAILDIVGKYYNQPIYNLLGGRYRDRIPLSWSLATGSLERDIEDAELKMEEGYQIFKLKVGVDPWKKDVKRLERIREVVGETVSLRVDANQGWDYTGAAQAISGMQACGLDFVEQPLPKWNISGMAALRRTFPVPLMADESLTDGHAALEMIKKGSVDIFAFKMTKLGGILAAYKAYQMAYDSQIAAYIGCMIETSLGTAAYLQFGASIPNLAYGCELWGPVLLKDDIVDDPIQYCDGHVLIPEKPGLGVTVNEDRLKPYLRNR